MTLLDFAIDLRRTNELLERQAVATERIAAALERLSPEVVAEPPAKPRKTEKIGMVDLQGTKRARAREVLQAQEELQGQDW